MKTTFTFLQKWNGVFSFCLLFFLSAIAYGQAESHDFITYDTTISYVGRGGQGGGSNKWQVRISRPRNYFTAGHPDTASRPLILTMPGASEVGSDTNNLVKYGPHYWLKQGWTGAVQLGNGTHYPLLITVCAAAAYPPPAYTQSLIDSLIKYYHPKAKSIHLGGLSAGSWAWGVALRYAQSAGDEHTMAKIASWTDLQGVPPTDVYGSEPAYPTSFGHWAKKFGGKFFGLEGTNDTRSINVIAKNMNDSSGGAAFFSFENDGGGNHCCWNDFYNPSFNHFVSGSFIYTSTSIPNMRGSYYEPSNLFQWMLRQGDTSMAGSAVSNLPPVANAGMSLSITLLLDSVVLSGSGSDPDGSVLSYAWTRVSGSGGVIVHPSAASTLVRGLSAGSYIFLLTVTDSLGASGSDTMTVTVRDTSSATLRSIYLNVYGGVNPYNNAAWNNWDASTAGSFSNLVFADGTASGCTVTQTLIGSSTPATTSIADNGSTYGGGTICPAEVLRYAAYSTVGRYLTFTGLNPGRIYSVSVFASRANTGNSTNFSINPGDTINIVSDTNHTRAATLAGVRPSAAGVLRVAVTRGVGGTYTYINGLVLSETGVAPAGASAAAAEKSVGAAAKMAGSVPAVSDDGRALAAGYHLYPNPSRGNEVSLVLNHPARGSLLVGITNRAGVLVKTLLYDKQSASFSTRLDLTGLPRGLYFVRLTMKGYHGVKELVKL